MSHKKLILQIKNGNAEALETVIREMYPQVYAFLYRKMNQNDKAKDITQEVFIRFVEHIDDYHEEDKLRNYLFRIGLNLMNNYYKSLKYLDDREMDEALLVNIEDPSMIVNRKVNQDRIMSYIQQLKPDYRDVILLRYYYELKFRDIAQILNAPESTIKSRHKIALNMLKKIMRKDGLYEKKV